MHTDEPDGLNRRPRPQGDHRGAGLEGAHHSLGVASSLRKDHQGVACFELLFGEPNCSPIGGIAVDREGADIGARH